MSMQLKRPADSCSPLCFLASPGAALVIPTVFAMASLIQTAVAAVTAFSSMLHDGTDEDAGKPAPTAAVVPAQ